MAKHSIRFRNALALIEHGKYYSTQHAISLIKQTATISPSQASRIIGATDEVIY